MSDDSPPWEIAADVGGTFTDVCTRSPEGQIGRLKVLSSGVTQGTAVTRVSDHEIADPARVGEPSGVHVGAVLTIGDRKIGPVIAFDGDRGVFTVDGPLPADVVGRRYVLDGDEPAPVLGARLATGTRVGGSLPPCRLRLGTTRGTNALLTRTGARTLFVTNRGFGDLLLIGDQARPRLFDLAIKKPDPLYDAVLEVDGRLAADGTELSPLDVDAVRSRLADAHAVGFEAVSVALLHAYREPSHEVVVGGLAREVGFNAVSLSHEVAPAIKIVPRAETTVADAYLTPVIRSYVGSIASRLPGGEASLKLMTSAGGLVGPAAFRGSASVLSGPAGGVVGLAEAARRCDALPAIGFDVGGTSTDVCRFDGRFTRTTDATKAGVRLSLPMLAIETVAAGGGSLCGFDGVRPTVGPGSAGADPGPACYGRGGPLTLTDVHVALGVVRPDHFPFALDVAAVDCALAGRAARLAEVGGPATAVAVAEGYRRIAIERTARAIRSITVADGHDPATHTLVAFGGAGPQLACAVASSLKIGRVVVPRDAGLLCAVGIGVAKLRREAVRIWLRPLDDATVADVVAWAAGRVATATEEVIAEGCEEADAARLTWELRYVGVEAAESVTTTFGEDGVDAGSLRASFEAAHRRRHGYERPGRAVEVMSVRLEVEGADAVGPEDVTSLTPDAGGVPLGSAEVVFGGRVQATPLWRADRLPVGTAVEGPLIAVGGGTTFLVEPGWSLSRSADGDLIAEATADGAVIDTAAVAAIDPVTTEVFHHRFASIAEQMGAVLRRTSVSTNVKERLDFSCAVFAGDGGLVANAPHVPVHLGAMGETVRAVMADHPDLGPGESVVTNDPSRGGSHLPDVTLVTPVFVDAESHDPRIAPRASDSPVERRPDFWVACRAHHAEIGGTVPGSVPPFSTRLSEEGVLLPSVRLSDVGEDRFAEVARLLASGRHPSRNVAENLADLEAQSAANRRGVDGLIGLAAECGVETVGRMMAAIRESSAAKVRRVLAAMPDGRYAAADHLDDGSPIAVAVKVSGERAVIDFAGTGPVIRDGNLNANRAIVTAAVTYVLRCLVADDVPMSGGLLDPVEIALPDCLLNPPAADDPVERAAVVGGNVETSQRVVDVLLAAFGVAAASQGTMNNLVFGDDTFGYYETLCGGSGATADADGADAVHTHMTNTRLTDPEVLEHRHPVRLRRFAVRHGSGGGGRRRGGDGVVRELEFLRPLSVSMLAERRGAYRPFGLDGGDAGEVGVATLIRSGGVEEPLGGRFSLDVRAGDVLRIETPGGGGFGAA
ncbi:MAG: hydantoinase B/oxoprolinase family protein [Planctomycetota bacterium]